MIFVRRRRAGVLIGLPEVNICRVSTTKKSVESPRPPRPGTLFRVAGLGPRLTPRRAEVRQHHVNQIIGTAPPLFIFAPCKFVLLKRWHKVRFCSWLEGSRYNIVYIRSPCGRRDAKTRRCCPYTGRDTASKEPLSHTRYKIGVTKTRSGRHSLERIEARGIPPGSYF